MADTVRLHLDHDLMIDDIVDPAEAAHIDVFA